MSYEITEVRKLCVFIKGSFQVLIDSRSIVNFQMLLLVIEKNNKNAYGEYFVTKRKCFIFAETGRTKFQHFSIQNKSIRVYEKRDE